MRLRRKGDILIRDDEFSRLTKYAQGLGLKVIVKSRPKMGDNAATWTTDGSEITIYKDENDTKIGLILAMIHELGHHVWFIHEKNRLPDLKFEQAIDRQNLVDEDLSDKPSPKKFREKILEVEIAGTGWWETIYKDTNMKFPKWKLFSEMELDVWMYQIYSETGFFPKRSERNRKIKEINGKHRK